MPDAAFVRPDLTTFCRLEELGLEVVGNGSSQIVRWRAGWWSRTSGAAGAAARACRGTRSQRDAIEAHLTVVFAALAISRYLQHATGVTIKRLVRTLRPLQSVVIGVDGHQIIADPTITPDAQDS